MSFLLPIDLKMIRQEYVDVEEVFNIASISYSLFFTSNITLLPRSIYLFIGFQ